jgi:hypothetical protein
LNWDDPFWSGNGFIPIDQITKQWLQNKDPSATFRIIDLGAYPQGAARNSEVPDLSKILRPLGLRDNACLALCLFHELLLRKLVNEQQILSFSVLLDDPESRKWKEALTSTSTKEPDEIIEFLAHCFGLSTKNPTSITVCSYNTITSHCSPYYEHLPDSYNQNKKKMHHINLIVIQNPADRYKSHYVIARHDNLLTSISKAEMRRDLAEALKKSRSRPKNSEYGKQPGSPNSPAPSSKRAYKKRCFDDNDLPSLSE